ncbi:MAG: SDR family NAD(P)-dependent oxidoreductase [Beutenbergiaceae bacterium]
MPIALESGTTAIVTGGARGIGLAIVEMMAADGVNVACVDVPTADFSQFEAVCAQAGVASQVVPVDVRNQDDVRSSFADVAHLGPVRYAVNCAGIDSPGDSDQVTASAWSRVIDIDLSGVFFSCQAEYDLMRERGGSIVNIASMSGHIINRGGAAHPAYSAAKAGVIHLSKALGVEWVTAGVRVNSVSPGYVKSALTDHNPPELNATFAAQTPAGRLGEVEEIAGPVLFLLSSAASYVTAADLSVDGGFTAW